MRLFFYYYFRGKSVIYKSDILKYFLCFMSYFFLLFILLTEQNMMCSYSPTISTAAGSYM